MKKDKKSDNIIFSRNNSETIRKITRDNRNIVVCGIQGVGKLTVTINAVGDMDEVFFLENTFDYDGKLKEKGYKKYTEYILSLKQDMTLISSFTDEAATPLFGEEKSKHIFGIRKHRVVVVDGIYGRNDVEIEHLLKLLGNKNVTVILIVRCIKYLHDLIRKFDVIVELTQDGALLLATETAEMICKVLKNSDVTD